MRERELPRRPTRRRHLAHILLIDDDVDLTDFLGPELEAAGHRVTVRNAAADAPDLLAKSPADLVVIDNRMPGMSGIEFLEALRQRALDVPVVLMTGHSTFDTAIEA